MNKLKKPKIIVTRSIPTAVADVLSANFLVEFNFNDQPFSPKKLKEAFEQSDGVLCTVSDQISSEMISSPRRTASIVANYGVGVSNIDLNQAKKNGLVVTNTPNVLTNATAEIALFLILAVSRRTSYLENKLRKQDWNGFSIIADLGSSMSEKTLGIIGMGRIGQATARKVVSALGMKVAYYNRSAVEDLDFDAKRMGSIEDLLKCSDVVSLHAPGGGLTPILTEKHFNIMKKSAFLINTARGDVLDQNALISALKNKLISGAGLDVYLNEPQVPEELLSLDNVTLLPHIGSATQETREAMGRLAVDNLEAHFFDKSYPSRVL